MCFVLRNITNRETTWFLFLAQKEDEQRELSGEVKARASAARPVTWCRRDRMAATRAPPRPGRPGSPGARSDGAGACAGGGAASAPRRGCLWRGGGRAC